MIPLLALTFAATPVYLDDRSSPEAVVASLYNAVALHDYARAWSYYLTPPAPDFNAFAAGYADTEALELRLGAATSEGAAGTIRTSVPVALRAVTREGVVVYTGCYLLSQVQPGLVTEPPYSPIAIREGHLSRTTEPFETAMGTCP